MASASYKMSLVKLCFLSQHFFIGAQRKSHLPVIMNQTSSTNDSIEQNCRYGKANLKIWLLVIQMAVHQRHPWIQAQLCVLDPNNAKKRCLRSGWMPTESVLTLDPGNSGMMTRNAFVALGVTLTSLTFSRAVSKLMNSASAVHVPICSKGRVRMAFVDWSWHQPKLFMYHSGHG